MHHLYLIRGLPGSGKSTLARNIMAGVDYYDTDRVIRHFEADQYFVKDGVYQFDRHKLTEAHRWCLAQTYKALKAGEHVVVSNTFITHVQMQPYRDVAHELGGLGVKTFVCLGSYGSIHGVPASTIERMKEMWED